MQYHPKMCEKPWKTCPALEDKKSGCPGGQPLLHAEIYFDWMYPFLHSSSASSTAPPAAPRRVLWLRQTNL